MSHSVNNKLSWAIISAVLFGTLFSLIFFATTISDDSSLIKKGIDVIADNPLEPAAENKMTIGEKEIKIAIADTIEKRTQGLSGLNYLEENSGMLFIFDSRQKASFWNKDTLIPLDLIWIKDKKITGIDYLPPAKEIIDLLIVNSPEEIDWVLEANAGWTEKNNIKTGDPVNLNLIK